MDDLNDDILATGFEPLFIREEEGHAERPRAEQEDLKPPPGLTHPKQPASMKPYLREMDDLLKSCEELTGIPLSSQYSASYDKTSQGESNHSRGEEEESYGGTFTCSQAYLSTSYIDTHMDEAIPREEPVQTGGLGTITGKCGAPLQIEMPLTSAGTKLRDTMVEYEGQLLGMLATLESCMEEAGMEFEPEEWGAGSGQEYVHIRSEPQHYRGTTLEPDMQEKPLRSEPQSIQFEAFEERDKSSKNSRRRIPDIPGNSVETPKGQSYFNEDRGLKFSFSGLKMLLDDTDQDPIYLEETKMEDMFRENTEKHGSGHGSDTVDPGLPSEDRNACEVDTIELRSGTDELKALGSRVENCIEEVQGLERRRKELLVEVLQLRGQTERTEVETEEWITRKVLELMDAFRREEGERREERKRRIQSLKEERAEEERRLWKVSLERNGLQDELRKLRRKLFSTVRDSTQSQAALNSQRREVEQLRTEEERMNSGLLQLMEESVQLRSAQQKQLSELRAKLQNQSSSQAPNRKEELSEGRRSSCGEVQQFLQGALKALEDRYEPILLALLKRREATAGALLKAKEESGGLKARLSPLREERQRLLLRRACLEEKLKLNHIQRLEEAARYKEAVLCLEESSRELRTELQLQKRKTKEMQELRDSLAKKLLLHRAAIEDQNKEDHEDSTRSYYHTRQKQLSELTL